MTGRIFLKIIAAVFCLLLVALITVDFLTGKVAQDAYIQNTVDQLAGKGRMLALAGRDPLSLDREQARRFAARRRCRRRRFCSSRRDRTRWTVCSVSKSAATIT